MVCEKCQTINNQNAKYCKACGSELNAVDTPLSGGERISIILYFVILLGMCFVGGAGIIPLVTSAATLYMIKTNKNINSIKMSKNIIIVACIGALLIFGFLAYKNGIGYNYSSNNTYFTINDNVIICSIFGSLSLSLIMLANELFFNIIEKRKKWVIKNGIFADIPKESKNQSVIIGRDNLSSFSIADEMLKWNELLEKGLVTKEEFDAAKQKLLQS